MNITASTYSNFVTGQMDTFYAEAYPSLLTFAARQLGPDFSFLAEDCVQDAIFKAYERRSQIGTPSHLKSFLYNTVHNAAVSLLRKQASEQRYLDRQGRPTEPDVHTAIIEQETLDLLFEAIDQLPDDLRQVFRLSFEEGLTNQEVAARMGLSESAVKKKKARMIALLRRRFADSPALQLLIMLLLSA